MVLPAKWQTFRKKYYDVARHGGDARAALREVTDGWAEVKRLRAAGAPGWRDDAEQRMQARINDGIARRAAEAARVAAAAAAAARDEADNAILLPQDADSRDRDLAARPTEDPNSFWRGGWQIGGRDDNSANIWLRINAQGRVGDRRVVKRTVVRYDRWADFTKWSGPDLRDLQNRTHMDYVISRRLCDLPTGGEHFVRVRGYRNTPATFSYRTIMDYCDSGDLDELRRAHVDRGIPEPLLRRIFEQLAKAAIIMEQGSLDGPVPGWQQIVHRDLKPANIFLATSNTMGDIYPDAKLGDFELAIETSPADVFNPDFVRAERVGDLNWMVPEARDRESRWMCSRIAGTLLPNLLGEQILAPANIWGIGACMFELINGGQWGVRFENYEDDPTGVRDAFRIAEGGEGREWMKEDDPTFQEWDDVAQNYSPHLIHAVKQCLMDHPNARITPTALLALINGPPVAEGEQQDEYSYEQDNERATNAKEDRIGTNYQNGRNLGEDWPDYINGGEFWYKQGLLWSNVRANRS